MNTKQIIYFFIALSLSLLFSACPEPPDPINPPFPEEFIITGLPIFYINTEKAKPITSKDTYLQASISLWDVVNVENPQLLLETTTDIKGRGNDSWTLPKKPYRLKFHDKQSLFGLPEAKSWILLANYRDYTLIMTSIAFELGHRFDLPFTHHYFPVEVVINGQHLGSYLLTEQKEVGKGRVDIDKKEGWLVEADTHWDETPKFKSNILKLPLMISSPEDLPNSGYDFVKNDINTFEAKLFEADYPNNNFMDFIDVKTFIDYIMINEIVQNIESIHPKSMYWYKDKGDHAKISLGPLWDFDWAFDFDSNTEKYFSNYSKLIFKDHGATNYIGAQLLSQLFKSQELKTLYKQRWNEMKQEVLSMTDFIDNEARKIQQSQKLNAEIWGWKGNDDEYMSEIARMKTWWINRINFLDSQIQSY